MHRTRSSRPRAPSPGARRCRLPAVGSDARSSLLELAAQLIAASTDGDGPLPARLADYFPWMLALNAEDQAACATDLIVSARASFATNQVHLAVAELTAWRETATAVAAGLGGADLVWIDEDEPVERP